MKNMKRWMMRGKALLQMTAFLMFHCCVRTFCKGILFPGIKVSNLENVWINFEDEFQNHYSSQSKLVKFHIISYHFMVKFHVISPTHHSQNWLSFISYHIISLLSFMSYHFSSQSKLVNFHIISYHFMVKFHVKSPSRHSQNWLSFLSPGNQSCMINFKF